MNSTPIPFKSMFQWYILFADSDDDSAVVRKKKNTVKSSMIQTVS